MDELVEKIARALALEKAGETYSREHVETVWLRPENKHWRDAARACLSAIEAEGMVIVPREPTEEMLRPGNPPYRFYPSEMGELWAAMLAAAPKHG